MIIREETVNEMAYDFNHGMFPRFFILAGPKHYGKKFMMRQLAKITQRVMLEPQDLKVGTIREFMKEAQALSAPTFFLFPDAEEMNTQAQNAILKFCEEPNNNAYIVMTVNNVDGLLNTIQSRARIRMMAPYSKSDVEKFCDTELQLKICDSPGQALYWKERDHILVLAKKVADTIDRVNYGNLFKISTYLNDIAETPDFCEALSYFFGQRAGKLTDYKRAFKQQSIISECKRLVEQKSFNKENAVIAMLLNLKEAENESR